MFFLFYEKRIQRSCEKNNRTEKKETKKKKRVLFLRKNRKETKRTNEFLFSYKKNRVKRKKEDCKNRAMLKNIKQPKKKKTRMRLILEKK